MSKLFSTILLDPPWPETKIGKFDETRHKRADEPPYSTLSIEDIAALPIGDLADTSCNIWLWTTSRSLPDGFDLLRRWGFKYLNTVTWVKPSGFGAWWVNRTQIMLMGYRGKLVMNEKYRPNVLFAPSRRHSQKPENSYELIERVSPGPYLEVFARTQRSPEWVAIGNEIDGKDIRESIAGFLN
ncbi:MT-A70 family methyltransferase [Frigoriglobus tundricola]|uniref:Adenine-specific DNA methyltransferase n=1 Tax=Frigoriglobus tundricola TaxID=2774151 RepID=A0A6M5YIA0_9BACT|nr:MT-A70 family methyltransferase [Frigoriglobus tundricola]QJW93264.1 hypothetical protein FTUN_0769 [Frigoriglobus tundricola]